MKRVGLLFGWKLHQLEYEFSFSAVRVMLLDMKRSTSR